MSLTDLSLKELEDRFFILAVIVLIFVYGIGFASGLENVTISVEEGTTTSCDEVGDAGGDTYVECRRVDALVDKERQALNKALENAYASPDKGDDLIADQLCEFRPYRYCASDSTTTTTEEDK